ncbi:MAG: C40 family peptidase [Eubacteriales bacterium]
MSGLKLGDTSLSIGHSEQKLDNFRKSKKKRQVTNRLYEKTKPSSNLHELAKPSDKLILDKKRQVNPELLPNQNKIPPHLRGELAKRDWLTPKSESPQGGQVVYRPLIELNAFVPQGDGDSEVDSTINFVENTASQINNTVTQINTTITEVALTEVEVANPLNWNVLDMGKPIQGKQSPVAHAHGKFGNSKLNFVKGSANTVQKFSEVQSSSDNDSDPSSQSLEMSQDLCQESAYHIHSSINNARLKGKQASIEKATVKEQFIHEHKSNFKLEKQRLKSSAEYSESNPLSKWQQRRKIKKKYAKEYRECMKTGRKVLRSQGNSSFLERQAAALAQRFRDGMMTIFRSIVTKPQIILLFLLGFLFMGMMSAMTSVTNMVMQAVIAGAFGTTSSSYTAEEDDLLKVESNYKDKEQELQEKIDNIESTMSGYDEYRYNLSEIGHDPHELAALLTALYHAYTPSQVASKLNEIFARQYTLTTVASTETKTDSEGNPIPWKVLTVTLTNTDIDSLAKDFLDDDQYGHYLLLKETKGNHPDLFGDYMGGSGGAVGDVDFEIPDHYLDDDAFARVYAEAIKYLGYPYKWGGQSPSTSFDCSGFMYWIYNSTGVYPHSRLTAGGYYNICTKFGADQRQAGDLIFFTGTSSHATISHVGMYIGDGMMIHSASAGVSFAPVDSGYWAKSDVFVCYGRLPI